MTTTINMYSIFDKKSNRYDTPFFAMDDLGAERHFIMTIRKPGNMLNQFKDDFELHRLSKFGVSTGMLSIEDYVIVLEGKQVNIEL